MNRQEAPAGAEEIKKSDILREAHKLSKQLEEGEEQPTSTTKKRVKDIVSKAELVKDTEELTIDHHYKSHDKVN